MWNRICSIAISVLIPLRKSCLAYVLSSSTLFLRQCLILMKILLIHVLMLLSPCADFLFLKSTKSKLKRKVVDIMIVQPFRRVLSLCVWGKLMSPLLVSATPIFSKVFERLVLKHHILPVLRNKLKSFQFAYLPGPGSVTSSALILIGNSMRNFNWF